MTTIKEVTVPDIGQFSAVEVIEVAIKEGALVNIEDPLITLETEKASMDIPSPLVGKIKEIKLKVGDKVSQGDLIALVETAEEEKKVTAEKTSLPDASPKKLIVNVPDIGSDQEVEVIEVAITPGQTVQKEGTLITLESEKASMDIPSPESGTVLSVLVKVGSKVKTGTAIAELSVSQELSLVKAAPSPSTQTFSAPVPAPAPSLTSIKPIAITPTTIHAGPATRRLARELGVDLSKVPGSGRKGRIITKDIHTYVKAILQNAQGAGGLNLEKAPEVDFSQFGAIETKPLSRIKKWTAKNLHRNWVMIPHVTQFDEADITELENYRKANKEKAEQSGFKLTPLVFIIKAVVAALKAFPQFNASLAANGTDLIYKKYCHIGVAVDTPNGLMVPVIRDADKKTLFDLAKDLVEKSGLAREGKLKAEQMQGSSFTLSSLGSIGGTAFTPIINAPDLAILGISKASIKPIYNGKEFVPRQMLPLSLSYDHRVIDGVEGAKFAAFIVSQLQDVKTLIL